MRAGARRDLFAFEAPVKVQDGKGGEVEGWEERFRDHVKVQYLRGGEAIQAARLSGVQPVVVTLSALSEQARSVTPAWRMKDTRAGTLYNIRSIVPSDDRRYNEITAESGVET